MGGPPLALRAPLAGRTGPLAERVADRRNAVVSLRAARLGEGAKKPSLFRLVAPGSQFDAREIFR